MGHVSALHVYPIKSCRGIELRSVRLDALGPLYDRRLMVIDEAGRFLRQSDAPKLALLTPQLAPTSLKVRAPEMPTLNVALRARGAERRAVSIWDDTVEAEDAGEEAAAWLEHFLEQPARLVRLPDNVARWTDPRYRAERAGVGFADGFPILLIGAASLADLNQHMARPLPMNRFRPNLVVEGFEPYAEDRWKRIRIAGVELDVVKPCARCSITTVNQATGQIDDKEPLATLATYRRHDSEVHFGQNCIHRDPGMLRVGDLVEVLDSE